MLLLRAYARNSREHSSKGREYLNIFVLLTGGGSGGTGGRVPPLKFSEGGRPP